MSGKKKYDLICSLGGNCSAAHNLLYRGLRHYSLPFDWLYIVDDKPINILSECFMNNFKYFCLKENLTNIPEGNSDEHKDKIQYLDKYSGYRFVNHFEYPIENGGYEPVKEKLDRRIARLYEKIAKGKNILFILATSFEMQTDSIYKLQNTLNNKFKDKNFEFIIIQFNCNNDSSIKDGNINVYKYKRSMNRYDYEKTNIEWAFLDELELNKTDKIKQRIHICYVKSLKKGIAVYILPHITTIFRIKLYLFGLRLDFCIGKVRNV